MRMTIFALALITLAAPAAAADPSVNQVAGASQAANGAKSAERKFCLRLDDIVGSRIRGRMQCKTEADWAREGLDLSRPSKD